MATQAQINNFIAMIAPIAIRQAKKHNNRVFPSVCIGQACHESGYGTSKKMVNANAVFGIKVGKSAYHFGSAWKGAGYKTGTTEYYDGVNPTKITDYFRAYDNIEDAVEDYFDMLCHCQRYKGALNQPSPEACIKGIVSGGYATGPQYAEHVMKIIRANHLDKYDPDAKFEYFPKYEGTGDSIINALDSMGIDSSREYRSKIYGINFTGTFRGTAQQNTSMLVLLKQGMLIKPS